MSFERKRHFSFCGQGSAASCNEEACLQAVACALQKDKGDAALAAALAALEGQHAAALSEPKAWARGNISVPVQHDVEALSEPELEAPAKLVRAQEALVAADELARDRRHAFQATTR